VKTIQYIDNAKKILDIQTDEGFAKWLGVTRTAVSNYRKEIRTIDDRAAVRIAEVLGIEPFTVIAQANLEREKTDEGRKFWRSVLRHVASVLMVSPALLFAAKMGILVSHYKCILCKIVAPKKFTKFA
jgi:plasmid maintenance system antidote protein VapI